MAIAILLVILLICFLPFKMLKNAFQLAEGRIDEQQQARVPLQRMVRELRKASGTITVTDGQQDSISYALDENRGGTWYKRTVSYYCQALTVGTPRVLGDPSSNFSLYVGGQPTEWSLIRTESSTDPAAVSRTRTEVPRGITQFSLSASSSTFLLVYVKCYSNQTRRPLSTTTSAAIEFGTSITTRNADGITTN